MTSNSTATTDLDYTDKLWKAANALRGQVDAAEYKHEPSGSLESFGRPLYIPAPTRSISV